MMFLFRHFCLGIFGLFDPLQQFSGKARTETWFVTFVTEVSLYSPRRKPEKTLSDYFIGRFAILFSDLFSFPPSTGILCAR